MLFTLTSWVQRMDVTRTIGYMDNARKRLGFSHFEVFGVNQYSCIGKRWSARQVFGLDIRQVFIVRIWYSPEEIYSFQTNNILDGLLLLGKNQKFSCAERVSLPQTTDKKSWIANREGSRIFNREVETMQMQRKCIEESNVEFIDNTVSEIERLYFNSVGGILYQRAFKNSTVFGFNNNRLFLRTYFSDKPFLLEKFAAFESDFIEKNHLFSVKNITDSMRKLPIVLSGFASYQIFNEYSSIFENKEESLKFLEDSNSNIIVEDFCDECEIGYIPKFDEEGTLTRNNIFFQRGRFVADMCTRTSAEKRGEKPSGNAHYMTAKRLKPNYLYVHSNDYQRCIYNEFYLIDSIKSFGMKTFDIKQKISVPVSGFLFIDGVPHRYFEKYFSFSISNLLSEAIVFEEKTKVGFGCSHSLHLPKAVLI